MWNSGSGFMAIWSDVEPADIEQYHNWLLKEHVAERVGIPGFVAVRVFRREVGPNLRFFILYETQAPSVLASPAYVERLNAPTPKTRAIMPKLKNFVRGAGRLVQSAGVCGGGTARVLRLGEADEILGDPGARAALLERLLGLDRVLAARLFEVDADATTIQTAEKKMRTSREESFGRLLVVEGVDEAALDAASTILEDALFDRTGAEHPFDQSYQLVAELQARSLQPA